jgi:hypothetical protein
VKVVDSILDRCYPIDLRVDVERLKADAKQIQERVGISSNFLIDELQKIPVTTFNLTHKPGLSGHERWKKWRGDHLMLEKEGVDEKDFTVMLSELDGTYLKQVMEDVFKQHQLRYGTPFIGRCQLITSRPGHTYRLHRDVHTKHRYHIPLVTEPNFVWLFQEEDNNFDVLHMPSDGRVWYLDPRNIKHTVVHVGTRPRWHILLTSNE